MDKYSDGSIVLDLGFEEHTHSDSNSQLQTESFSCDFENCPKIFSKMSALIKHKKLHEGHKPYRCKICNSTFTQSSNLRRHERIHSGEKPYTCEYCNKNFLTNSNLKQHQVIHFDLRSKFKCQQCSKGYFYKSSLKKHMLSHAKDDKKKRKSSETFSTSQLSDQSRETTYVKPVAAPIVPVQPIVSSIKKNNSVQIKMEIQQELGLNHFSSENLRQMEEVQCKQEVQYYNDDDFMGYKFQQEDDAMEFEENLGFLSMNPKQVNLLQKALKTNEIVNFENDYSDLKPAKYVQPQYELQTASTALTCQGPTKADNQNQDLYFDDEIIFKQNSNDKYYEEIMKSITDVDQYFLYGN